MWDVYTSATGVVAWLGPSGQEGEAAMEAIKDIGIKVKDVNEGDITDLGPSELMKLGVDVTRIDWRSIWTFLNRPYWRRVWIVQELASRNDYGDTDMSIITCGSRLMFKYEFEGFIKLLTMLAFHKGNKFNGDGENMIEPFQSLSTSGPPSAARMFMTYYAGYDLEGLLGLAIFFQASVTHDLIYGLLDLVPDEEKHLVIPDYSKPIKSVYTDICKGLILHSQSLGSILYNRMSCYGQRPSWISGVVPRIPTGPLWSNDETAFQAATTLPMRICPKDLTQHLAVKGIRIGILDSVIGPHHHPLVSELRQQAEAQFRNITPDYKPPIALEFEEFLWEVKKYSEALSDDDLEGVWRTLVMDHDMTDIDDPIRPAPKDFGKDFELLRTEELPASLEPDMQEQERLITYFNQSRFLRNVVNNTKNRCFFRTTCGKMGLGPYCSIQGDVIAALFGGERFFLLRPASTGYEVIRDAYVHGGMYGEFVSTCLNGDDSAVEEFMLC